MRRVGATMVKAAILLFATDKISLFLFRKTRSSSVPREVFGNKPLPGTLVVDRYNAYNKVPCALQYCYSHLLREVEEIGKEFSEVDEVKTLCGRPGPLCWQQLYIFVPYSSLMLSSINKRQRSKTRSLRWFMLPLIIWPSVASRKSFMTMRIGCTGGPKTDAFLRITIWLREISGPRSLLAKSASVLSPMLKPRPEAF